MAELEISNLIKIILGIFVVCAVIVGLYIAFKENIMSFFENLVPELGLPLL